MAQAHVRSKEATRQRIVDAAIAVFAEKGYHAAGVDDIVRAAGASKGGFYFHFPSKEEVFVALVETLAERLAAGVVEAIQRHRGGVARVDAALAAAFATFSQHRHLARILLVGAVGVGPSLDQRILELRSRFAALIQVHLDQAVAEGDLPPQDTTVAALAWLGAVNEVVLHWLYTGRPDPLEAALPALRALLLRSVGATPTPPCAQESS